MSADIHGNAAKFFGGHHFDENFGVEAGCAALGSFSETVSIAGAPVKQDGKARSIYGAATGRLPLGDALALHGLALHGGLGVSLGKVSGTPSRRPATT